MSTKKRKRPPVKGKNYKSINDLRVFGFVLAILVIFTLAGIVFYSRVVNPDWEPTFRIGDETNDDSGSGDEDKTEDNVSGNEAVTDNRDSEGKVTAPESVSPQEYLEEVENKIKENNRQTPDKYDESFKEYEKKLNDMELELNNDDLQKNFNDMQNEFNKSTESFDKEIEESFGDLDFSLEDSE